MQILSLVDPSKGHIQYKANNYPDGQKDITIEPHTVNVNEPVSIESRFNSFNDLGVIIAATCALRNIYFDAQKEARIHLYIPYLLGARSDRKFVPGGIRYLRQVVAPVINAQNFASVTIMDPHSDVVENVIDNVVKVDNIKLVDFALDFIWPEQVSTKEETDQLRNMTEVVSPDAGAMKKIYPVLEEFELENIIIASKHRDIKNGAILSTDVPLTISYPNLVGEPYEKRYVIIDDICDGGRTFTEIAKVIINRYKEAGIAKKPVIVLIVTHGIFSAGFDELSQYFDAIYTTNSIYDQSVTSKGHIADTLVKQLNIF